MPLTEAEEIELIALLEMQEKAKRWQSALVSLPTLKRNEANELYLDALNEGAILKELCLKDLFFLLTHACKRKDIDRDWLYDRCREVQAAPDGYLDLWSREHYKSTLITFGKSIQDLSQQIQTIRSLVFSRTQDRLLKLS
jgi:hypothetical protein